MTTLCQITMNAGDDISGSVIKWNLKINADNFDRIIVVDGNLTEKAKEFYSQFENLEWIDSPWCDSYVKQYDAWKSKLKDGEGALYLDCDEVPSEDLSGICPWLEEVGEGDIYRVPCVLYITENGKSYYAVEVEPEREYKGQWTKNIFIRKPENVYFRYFGSHVVPEGKSYNYTRFPYYHMKSLESFVYNDVWQAFLFPAGQQYTDLESALFKRYAYEFKTTAEFKRAAMNGQWSPPLQKFAWDNRWKVTKPISRLAWTYFLLYGHPFLEKDESFTWENVKQYVLGEESMELFEKNKQEGNFIDVSSY